MSTARKFWLVWNPQQGPPTMRHYSEQDARNEAERLALCHPHDTFIVLESLAEVRKRQVEWVESVEEEEGLPF